MSSGGVEHDGSENTRPRWREWVLLEGERHHVTGLTVGGVFLVLATVSGSRFAPLRDTQALFYVFSAMISGNLTVVTVVVAINQLLLSREFYTPDELRSEMNGIIDYRRDVEDRAGEIAPVDLEEFLRFLVDSTRREAREVERLAASGAADRHRDELESIAAELAAHTDRIDRLLRESSESTFDVLAATLTADYAEVLVDLRRIKTEYGEGAGSDVETAIDDLVRSLRDIGIARQYFKTIYLQEELASLSRQLFYVGVASLVFVAAGLLLFTAPNGASVTRRYLTILVPTLMTAGFVPLSLLFAVILRVSTVARRTTATLPFTTPTREE